MSALSKENRKNVWLIVGILIMLLGYVLPPAGAMTQMGWRIVCLLVGVVVMISGHGNMLVAAFLACFDLAFTGYMTGTEAMNKIMGSSAIVQMIFMIAFCYIVQKTGATDVMGKKIMSIKFVQGKPILFSAMFLLACGICGIFVSYTTALPIYLALWEGVAHAIGLDPDDKYNKYMLTGVYVTMSLAGTMIPFKGLLAVFIGFFEGIIQSYNYHFNYTLNFLVVALVMVGWTIIYALLMKYLFKCDSMNLIKTFDVNRMEGMSAEEKKFTNRQKVVLITFIVTLFYTIIPTFLPASDFMTKWKAISMSVVAMFAMALLAVFKCPEDKQPYANLTEALSKGISWGPYMVAWTLMLISGALSDESLGIATTLSNALSFTKSLPYVLFCFIGLLVIHVITNFFSNSGTFYMMAAVMAPLAIGFGADGSVNISPMLSCMLMLDMAAYWTVSGGPAAAWLYERKGMSGGWVLKVGPVISIFLVLWCTIVSVVTGYIF